MTTDPSHDPPTFKLRGVRPYLSTKGDVMILVARLQEETRNLRLFSNQFPLTISIASDLLHEVLECLAMWESSWKKEMTTIQFLPMKSEAKENDLKVEMEQDKTEWLSDISLCIGPGNCGAIDKEKCVEASKPSGGLIDKGGGMCFSPRRMHEDGVLRSVSVQLPMLPYFLHDLPPVTSNFNNSQALHESIHESSEGHMPFRMYSSGRIGPLSSANLHQNMLDQQHQQQTPRKTRRCWSRELHRKFEKALEELGGPEVATPKQIREVMKVDGLTNDEVKSHLQKYRMHAKKSSSPAVHLDLHLKSSPVSSPDCPLEFSRFAHWQGQSESYGSELDMNRCIEEYSG